MTIAHGETEPLLANTAHDAPVRSRSRNSKLLVLIACSTFILAADFGFFMAQAPQTAIFEEIICRHHAIQSRGINATIDGVDPCKSELVQGELALILGYRDTFDVLPGILLLLPFGILADRWGRKPVLYLSVLGVLLSETWIRLVCYFSDFMPLRMVWLSGLWRMIGGGDQVASNVCLVMVADIFSEEERSNALFLLQSAVLLAEVLATPLSAYLMTFDPAFPYVLGLIILMIGSLPVFFLPETLEDAKAKKPSQQNVSTDATGPTDPLDKAVLPELVRQIREFKESTRFIWRNRNVCLMIVTMFVSNISRQSSNMLLQYSSKKFNWSIARASLLISLRGIVQLVNFLVLMPALFFIAARYLDLHGKYRDYRLCQASGILSIIGFAAMGLAPVPVLLICGLVIMSLGTTFTVTTRSLVTSLVPPDHVGTLYSAIGISQAIGVFVAGPLFAYLFKLGMHLGNAWMGMPFLQAALFYLVATVAVWRVRIGGSGTDEEQEPLVSE
ncbi:uncharacterized protein N7498_005894 [Penicillium cinerascens]|uniref:Major facilitator superfamily (MFS) profile domain-containing protein n=1 Tax=Penicillium cinerascens TaxID=70096 RepID=A0A9W9MPG7_9EURO|nr:uncharacterized protein N7498_005894 [Penicillium cinerascens]KAJ5205015.1 hypothetical protein N7498_005894 [Penicillium cinerascens]